jgi:bacterioferritin
MEKPGQFVMDIQGLRDRARKDMEQGAVTQDYSISPTQAATVLNSALATEWVCVLRYRFHAACAQGIDSESVKAEFLEHANEELRHADMIAERINQLGGKPELNPEGLSQRSHSQYVEGNDLVDMIKENLVAERIAIESYRRMVQFFGDRDPTTRRMLEEILAKEEEHATDMQDLLVAREGQPMLSH